MRYKCLHQLQLGNKRYQIPYKTIYTYTKSAIQAALAIRGFGNRGIFLEHNPRV